MFGDLGKIMRMAGQMKAKMPQVQEKLAVSEYAAEAMKELTGGMDISGPDKMIQ